MRKFWHLVLSSLLAVDLLLIYLIVKSPVLTWQVYILDVGQGDSILIKSKDNHYVLVDGGPDKSSLQQLQQIIPFWNRHLDAVILTHPDQDHVGGLPFVLDYYDTDYIFYTPVEHDNWAFDELQNIVKTRGIEHFPLDESKDFQLGCCMSFDLLWPSLEVANSLKSRVSAGSGAPKVDVNDISTAFVLMVDDKKMYFGGDLSSAYEEEIFAKPGSSSRAYDLDLIKLGHHGSRTSTSVEFLELTTPEIGVISAGEDNKFGHPHEEVLENLQRFNIKVLRTDQMGRVTIGPGDF